VVQKDQAKISLLIIFIFACISDLMFQRLIQKDFVSGIAVPVFDSISSFSGYQDLLIVIFAYL